MEPMRFTAARSRHFNSDAAAMEVTEQAGAAGIEAPDLAVIFLTSAHRAGAAAIQARIRETLRPRVLLGCTCEGVIGADDEIEREPGLALLLGRLPGVSVTPFHVGVTEWRSVLANGENLAERIGAAPDTRAVLLLADPFSTPVGPLLAGIDSLQAGAPAVGGMASGAEQGGGNALLLDDDLYTDGTVGVTLSGPVWVDTVVSQGCRPVGQRFLVTAAEKNRVESLGGRPALDAVRELVDGLDAEEQHLLANGLFLGVVIDEYRDTFERGDFLVRNVVGVDSGTGALAVGDHIRPGQTVQFHVRDAETAEEDLRDLLARLGRTDAPAGGLLFSCNGRGTRLFEAPCQDISTVLRALPGTPMAGFFAMGELGPVGGRSFMHGQTASLAFFRPME